MSEIIASSSGDDDSKKNSVEATVEDTAEDYSSCSESVANNTNNSDDDGESTTTASEDNNNEESLRKMARKAKRSARKSHKATKKLQQEIEELKLQLNATANEDDSSSSRESDDDDDDDFSSIREVLQGQNVQVHVLDFDLHEVAAERSSGTKSDKVVEANKIIPKDVFMTPKAFQAFLNNETLPAAKEESAKPVVDSDDHTKKKCKLHDKDNDDSKKTWKLCEMTHWETDSIEYYTIGKPDIVNACRRTHQRHAMLHYSHASLFYYKNKRMDIEMDFLLTELWEFVTAPQSSTTRSNGFVLLATDGVQKYWLLQWVPATCSACGGAKVSATTTPGHIVVQPFLHGARALVRFRELLSASLLIPSTTSRNNNNNNEYQHNNHQPQLTGANAGDDDDDDEETASVSRDFEIV